jgi:squalene synthase HpnC
MTAAAIDLASGKGHKDENFPVASFLLKREARAPVMAFYRFARAADDVSDHATVPPEEKLRVLETMRASLTGESDADPVSAALRETIASHGLSARHPLDLLEAFRRDVTKLRYADWDDLMDYCRYSAMPVGRFVLDVHGEDQSTWPANDALCAALQVINHLQDCAKDRANLDRVYLTEDLLTREGAAIADLDAPKASPALRRVIRDMVEKTSALLDQSRTFAKHIKDRRLSAEVAIIQRLAEDLVERLRHRDPLSERVHHSKTEAASLALSAVVRRFMGRS